MSNDGPSAAQPSAPGSPTGSMASSSAIKIVADLGGLVSGTVVGIVTARELGPSGKGTLSALLFMSAFLGQACLLGMGDASVVWIAQGRVTVQRALSCGLAISMGSSLVGVAVLLGYGVLQLPTGDAYVAPALAASACALAITGATQMLLFIVYGTGGAVAVSMVTLLWTTTSAFAVVYLVAFLNLELLGATVGTLAGGVVGLVSGVVLVRRQEVRVRLSFDRAYAASAIGYGLKTQFANLFAVSSARMDLLLVYAIAGSGAAGQYSVALTIGALAGTAALAVSYASFSAVAGAQEAVAINLLLRTVRTGLILSIGVALLGLVIVPLAVPFAFGQSYSSAVTPSCVLLVANIFWSGQWILSRGLAARGDPKLVLYSFAANLTVMVIGDLLLVPSFDATGGAIASLAASAVGFFMCVRRFGQLGVSARRLLPRPKDALDIAAVPGRLFESLVVRRRLKGSGT